MSTRVHGELAGVALGAYLSYAPSVYPHLDPLSRELTVRENGERMWLIVSRADTAAKG